MIRHSVLIVREKSDSRGFLRQHISTVGLVCTAALWLAHFDVTLRVVICVVHHIFCFKEAYLNEVE